MEKIKWFIINWVWCQPQTLIGFFWFLLVKYRGQGRDGQRFYRAYHTAYKDFKRPGVSLGYFIFSNNTFLLKSHEYGHYLQNLILGPLYLPVVGFQSFVWARIHKNFETKYFEFWTEKWANNLAGITYLLNKPPR